MTKAPIIKKPAAKPVSGYKLSNISKLRLNGVDPKLVAVIERALELSTTDFLVLEGLRTKERQAELVRKGASKTMNSRHIIGQAVDIAPLIDGQVRWDWPAFYPLAVAVRAAAIELGVKVTWGGVWDRPINDLSEDVEDEVADYVARQREANRKAGRKNSILIDGPHWQIEK